jgi:hypothetical protein
MDRPYASSWTRAHENFQAREYDARASQESQCRDNGLLKKRPAQILKYLEPLMKHQVEEHLYNVNGL